ncbi:hypothetical protein SISSUDRAFT_1049692 [Sistotremastrum suecicum HHB10207 ss-3]|uniref:F-box domain-containing protein n=1 Tax=Sistotremastrum suecicum HHB10207 ss-3 TaxID=1314776 RepID=A0A166BMR0_9AGAM|nr:hypothetical protein SISSUDRAFT_1049692 [Sistotremastrum suecicum HHB10207 ss-3]
MLQSTDHDILLAHLENVVGVLEAALDEVRALASDIVKERRIVSTQEKQCERENALKLLRDTTSSITRIGTKIQCGFSRAIAGICEQSNEYTEICRLPYDLISDILTEYIPNHPEKVHSMSRRPRWICLSEVCRKWNWVLKEASKPWTFINLAWPTKVIEYHALLSKKSPLHIAWGLSGDVSSPGSDRTDWLLCHKDTIKDLELGVEWYMAGDRTKLLFLDLLARYFTASPAKLKSLELFLPLFGMTRLHEEVSVLLPPLSTLDLEHLRLNNCWPKGTLPSSLRTLEVISMSSSVVTVRNIHQILSECSLLETCSLDIDCGSMDLFTMSTAPLPNSSLSLPRLRSLELGKLSQTELEWLSERVHLEDVPELRISIIVSPPLKPPFKLPVQFHHHATRSEWLEVGKQDIDYCSPNFFRHKFDISQYPQTSMDLPLLTLDFQLFTLVQQLVLKSYTSARWALWSSAFCSFSNLKDLHIRGSQTEVSELLIPLGREIPFICPKLRVLSLEDDGEWKWTMSKTDAHFQSKKRVANDRLETLLKVRAEQGNSLQKLILSADNWWSDDPERWGALVDGVEKRAANNASRSPW